MKLTGSEDIESANSVADRLGMPFHVFDLAAVFRETVIDKFVSVYQSGGTPNPCIDCNRHMKFGKLFDCADTLGAKYLVTGHYARIGQDEASGRYLLKKAADESKDQTYFLYTLTQERLARTMFPLGEFRKSGIRAMAAEQGFANADKSDSQDICFVRDGDYAAFIEQYTGSACRRGDFLDVHGNIIGRHNGVIRYTVGQRRGLGLALPHTMYVQSKNAAANTVTLCDNAEALCSQSLEADDFNWVACDTPSAGTEIRVKAKIRYNQREQAATAVVTDSGTVRVTFAEPQKAVAPGQSVVLYDGDTVVGGGVILKE
jgi:tRNA-specific 2-thiouridylase